MIEFVMRAAQPSDPIARLDIYDAQRGRVLAARDVTSAELGTSNQWARAALRVTVSTGCASCAHSSARRSPKRTRGCS